MKITKVTNYANASQDDAISNLEKELVSYAELQAKHNGQNNEPVNETQFRVFILNRIESKVQAAIDYNQQTYLPVSGMVVANQINTEATKNIATMHSSLKDDEHKSCQLEIEKKKLTPDLSKRRIRMFVYIGAGIVALAEGYFANEALRQASFPWLSAFITSIGIAVAIGFGLHTLAGFILKAQTNLQRIIRYSVVLIPSFIGFYALGHLRASAYNSLSKFDLHLNKILNTPMENISAWSITIISFLLFVVSLLFSIKFYKTNEEQRQEQEYCNTCKECKEIKKRINAKHKAIKEINSEAKQKSDVALARYEAALATENRLQAIAKQTLHAYINQNMRYRTDKQCPEFFSMLPSFNFKLFFDNLKKN